MPGASTWNNKQNEEVLQKAQTYLGIVVAAICGATLAPADLGVLNHYEHTSNSLDYLKFGSKQYSGEKLYKQSNSYTDRNLIAANSAGGLAWARDI